MKIAIVKLSALGDIVHAMIVLQFIKKYNQSIQIDWIVEERYKNLLEFNPDIDKVHVINIKKAKQEKSIYLLLSELKKLRNLGPYDLVIDMQGLLKSAVIARLIPSPITLGFDKFSIRESIASIFYNKTFNCRYDKNIIERNLALAEFAFGIKIIKTQIKNKHPFLYSNKKYFIDNLLKIKNNVLLIPGASHKTKCYPVTNLAELTTLLDANFFIIWGNQKEKKLADKLKCLSPNINVCEKLSIDLLIPLISQMNLIIGPDTGPTHMGWALNIPSITLFGPTPGDRNSFVTKVNKIIESNSLVNPFKIDKNDYSIKEISVQEIQKISKELLR
ncbi:lipopolysaccharide heptosyltransferase I [Candidatus Thioglobus sp.]|nr:lipopolysaccharide heptosyltransferase I [Candidatus Thioglobus sp.]